MKHLMCAALLASALLAAGCLTGCSSLYDPSDVEDPAGVGTSALLGEDGTEALAAIYKDALARSGLEAGGDQRVQDALNQALNRRTADGSGLTRALKASLRRAGVDAAVYSDLPSLLASEEAGVCCILRMPTLPGAAGPDAATLPAAVQEDERRPEGRHGVPGLPQRGGRPGRPRRLCAAAGPHLKQIETGKALSDGRAFDFFDG